MINTEFKMINTKFKNIKIKNYQTDVIDNLNII